VLREAMNEIWLRLRALVRRRRLDHDLEDELAFHLAMREDKYRAEGLDPQRAREAAQRRFGNVLSLKEPVASSGRSVLLSGQARTCATACACYGGIPDSR
jgi:hypothetical protein